MKKDMFYHLLNTGVSVNFSPYRKNYKVKYVKLQNFQLNASFY